MIKRILLGVVITLAIGCSAKSGTSAAQAQEKTSPSSPSSTLPRTLEEMKERHQQLGREPQGAVKCFIDAVFVYMNPDTRNEGRRMIQLLAIPLIDHEDWDKLPSNRLFVDRIVNASHHHIWRSYAKGTSPENAYAMEKNAWELNFERTHRHDDDERGLQVYLRSSGADSPRVVYVKQNTSTDLYYINIWNTLFVGIRAPMKPAQPQFK